MPSPPPQPAKAPAECVTVWTNIFMGGPYTGLGMLRYIMKAGGATPPRFVADPRVVAGVTDTKIKGKHSIAQMQEIWAQATGRCTSFAVKAITTLDPKGGKYQFEIYDLAGHRVARCRKTGVVIDSSSTMPGGAFVLPEGGWARFEKTDASWKFKSSESKFESQGNAAGAVKKSSSPISKDQAMWLCLDGVEANAGRSVPTLFRSIDAATHQPVYHGMVCWVLSKRALELVPNIAREHRSKKIVIQWSTGKDKKPGTEQDLGQCVEALEQFVKNYGGPPGNGDRQWAADGINQFNDQLFAAAVEAWGFPRLDESKMR